MVDHKKTNEQGIPRTSQKSMNSEGKPVRGIDWTEIFRRHPELEAPGYVEALREARLRRNQGE